MADLAQLVIQIKLTGAATAINQIKRLNTQAIRLSRAQVNLGQTAERAEEGIEDIGDAAEKAANQMKMIQRSTTATNTSLSSTASSLRTVGRDFISNFTVPITAAAAASIMFSRDLNSGLANTQSLLTGTFEENTDRILQFRDAVTDASVTFGRDFGDLTEGLYQSISAFQDGEDAIDRFNVAVQAGVAGRASTSDSVALLSAVTRAYGDTTTRATARVADLAFETVRLGQTTFPQLANAVQLVTATSDRLGVSQEELFTVFATLTGVTGDASQVATQFRSINASLLSPTKELTALLTSQGFASSQAAVDQLGYIGVLQLINQETERTGRPFQDFIRRIEGINAATVLTGSQFENYIDRLDQVSRATGALDKATEAQTMGIGALDFQLNQIRQRFATLGDLLARTVLPALVDLLDNVVSIAETLTNAFGPGLVSVLGGTLALIGPLTLLSGQIVRLVALFKTAGVAFTAALGPWAAVIGGAVVAVGALAVAVEKARNPVVELNEDQQIALTANARLRDSVDELVASRTMERAVIAELIERYPQLNEILDASTATLDEVERAANQVTIETLREELSDELMQLVDANAVMRSLQTQVDEITEQVEAVPSIIQGRMLMAAGQLSEEDFNVAYQAVSGRLNLTGTQRLLDAAEARYMAFLNTITQAASDQDILFEFDPYQYGPVFAPVVDDINTLNDGMEEGEKNAAAVGRRLETWQEHFARITGTPLDRFTMAMRDARGRITGIVEGTDDQANAASAYLQIIEETNQEFRSLQTLGMAGTTMMGQSAQALTNELETLGQLSISAEDLQGIIFQLISIRKENIAGSREFELADQAITALLPKIRELSQREQALGDIQRFNEVHNADIENRRLRSAGLTSESQYLRDQISLYDEQVRMYVAAGDTSSAFYMSASQNAQRYRNDLAELTAEQQLGNNLGISEGAQQLLTFSTALTENREALGAFFEGAGSLMDVFTNIQKAIMGTDEESKELAESLLAIAQVGVMIASQALADGFTAIGDALATGADAGNAFGEVIAMIALQLLKQLPLLFIQAGLQAIIMGNLPLGLGLIAAGAVTGIVSGAVQSQIPESEGGTRGSALGNMFGVPITPFQRGGYFTNSVVNSPTRFSFQRGTGLMGEAGPEAIVPLRRMSGGQLGVDAANAAPSVTVNVINNSSAQVQTSERQEDGSRIIEMRIMEAVNNVIASGQADRTMNSRFGIRSRGT